jgi:hypothetical protein
VARRAGRPGNRCFHDIPRENDTLKCANGRVAAFQVRRAHAKARTRRPVHLAMCLSCGGCGLLPVSSRRLVQTVRCPFPVMHVGRANVAARRPVVIGPTLAPSQTKKTGEVRALRRRVTNDRFASVVRPVLFDVRLSVAPPQPRRRNGIPRPRPRSRLLRRSLPLLTGTTDSLRLP